MTGPTTYDINGNPAGHMERVPDDEPIRLHPGFPVPRERMAVTAFTDEHRTQLGITSWRTAVTGSEREAIAAALAEIDRLRAVLQDARIWLSCVDGEDDEDREGLREIVERIDGLLPAEATP